MRHEHEGIADDEARGPDRQLADEGHRRDRGQERILAFVRARRAGHADEGREHRRLTIDDRRSKPLGSRGSTMVNSTLADVKTTTTRPSAKRTVSMGPAGSVWRSLGHASVSPLGRAHRTVGRWAALRGSGDVTAVTVAPGGSSNNEAEGDEE